MTHKYKELMQILIEDGEDIEEKNKDLNINKKSEKESNKNKNEKISCCTISTEPMDLKNKQKEEYNFENKTIIIGKTKEIKDKNNNEIENKIEEQKNVTKPKLCTKTISI